MIVSDTDVRTALGLSTSDPNLPMLLSIRNRVERLVKKYVKYNVEHASHTEFLPAGGRDLAYDPLEDGGWRGGRVGAYADTQILLSNLPVRSIEAVYRDQYRVFGPSTLLQASSYRLDCETPDLCESGIVVCDRGWDWTPRSVKVVYTAGWTAGEFLDEASDFPMAVVSACQKFFNEWVANLAATDTAGTGAISAEGYETPNLYYARAAENSGLMNSLPASAMKILEDRVRKTY